jgi:hypothetical protein
VAHKFSDAWFKNSKGDWALGAWPNAPLITWAVAAMVNRVASGTVATLAGAVAYGALFVWAWLELFKGVNYFRRLLGAIVLAYLLFSAVKHGYFGP